MNRYQYLFDFCREYMIICNKDGYITETNKAAVQETGYFEELIGTDICKLLPLIFERDGEGRIVYTKEDGEEAETILYRKNETCFPVSCRLASWEEDNEKVFACCLWNNSKLSEALSSGRRAMKELEEAAKVKSEFLANVTHELRTPLNGINGLVENLLDTPLMPAQVETVNIIKRSSSNMTKIINDLLDFAKLESGKLVLEKREFNLHSFLKETLAVHSMRVGEKGLRLVVRLAQDIPERVIGDELRLGQVINNLLSNACKFTTVGHIVFEAAVTQCEGKETELLFMISDTGIGISPEESDKLFQRFSQVDGSITRRFGGTGLGLAICKELVEMMGGSIQVNSEKGKGSTFSFTVWLEAVGSGNFVWKPIEPPKFEESVRAFTEEQEDNKKEILDAIEKLELCTELGTWGKAENFAGIIKQRIPEEKEELAKKAFRLEMMVRREDAEKTALLLKEVRDLVEVQIE
ncbi:MAG: PAS domain-containing protein [Lachnospiraceae bacterium]|nr:PAS domain-containing protein [Lachnospiraceae bacterium]